MEFFFLFRWNLCCGFFIVKSYAMGNSVIIFVILNFNTGIILIDMVGNTITNTIEIWLVWKWGQISPAGAFFTRPSHAMIWKVL